MGGAEPPRRKERDPRIPKVMKRARQTEDLFCVRHCVQSASQVLLQPSRSVPHFTESETKAQRAEGLAQGHTAIKFWCLNSNPGPELFAPALPCLSQPRPAVRSPLFHVDLRGLWFPGRFGFALQAATLAPSPVVRTPFRRVLG